MPRPVLLCSSSCRLFRFLRLGRRKAERALGNALVPLDLPRLRSLAVLPESWLRGLRVAGAAELLLDLLLPLLPWPPALSPERVRRVGSQLLHHPSLLLLLLRRSLLSPVMSPEGKAVLE